MGQVSSCCGVSDRDAGDGDGPSYSDIGICPSCKEHCDFEDEEEDEETEDPTGTIPQAISDTPQA